MRIYQESSGRLRQSQQITHDRFNLVCRRLRTRHFIRFPSMHLWKPLCVGLWICQVIYKKRDLTPSADTIERRSSGSSSPAD